MTIIRTQHHPFELNFICTVFLPSFTYLGWHRPALSGLHCAPSSPSRKSGLYCLDRNLESICGWRYLELCFYAPIRFGKSAIGSRGNCDRSTHRMQSRLKITIFSRGRRCTKRILQMPSVIHDLADFAIAMLQLCACDNL